MKRFPAQIGITYFSVLVAAFYLPQIITAILGGVALLVGAVFLLITKIRKTIYLPAVAFTVAVACAVNIGYTAFFVEPVMEPYEGATHTVVAQLQDEPYRSYHKYYYCLQTVSIDGEDVSMRLLLKTPRALDAEPDDILTFTSELNAVENNYYRAKGYSLMADDYSVFVDVKEAEAHSLYYHVIELRTFMRRTLNRFLPKDCAALCRAVLIGDKYALGTDVRNNFRYAGASYFIVVSGMHFAVLCMLLMRVMKRLNRWLRLGLILLFMLLYAAVTGFQPSVLRSGVMMLFTVIGITIRRQPYPLNHLGLSGLVLPLILSPYCAGDVGLILSFYATLAILLWAAPIARKLCLKDEYDNIIRFHFDAWLHKAIKRLKAIFSHESTKSKEEKQIFSLRMFLMKLWNSFAALLSVSLAANILVFPISVFVFHEFSLVTLLSGVLLYLEIYLILLLSLFVILFCWIKPLAAFLAFPLMLLCRLVLWIVENIGSFPFAYCRIGGGFVYGWMAVTALLGLTVILYHNHYRYLKLAALCSAVVLLGGGLTHALLQAQVLSLEVYSCGDGICAAVNDGGRLHLLSMDASTKYLYPIWKSLSYRFGGAQTALCTDESDLRNFQLYSDDEFAISSLLLYDKDNYSADDDNIVSFNSDSTFLLNDELTLNVAVNGGVSATYVTAGQKRVLIVPRGCDANDIPAPYRQADIIVLSTAVAGMEQLSCDEMIICDDSDLALYTATALKDCYNHVYFTAEGDVTLRLR